MFNSYIKCNLLSAMSLSFWRGLSGPSRT